VLGDRRWSRKAFPPSISPGAEALLRIGASALLAPAPQADRLSPFVILSLSACALALAVVELAHRMTDPNLDFSPSRIFAGVITGTGFLVPCAPLTWRYDRTKTPLAR
jgi:hypothetical protein